MATARRAPRRPPTLNLVARVQPERGVLPGAFYLGADPVPIARALLGKVLCTAVEGALTSAIIVETEAYSGENDLACHARLSRRTRRTEVLYREGGRSYVYLCYGLHCLFNVVTDIEGRADAVLIRAGAPLEGVDAMKRRRGDRPVETLMRGPATLCRALGITLAHNDTALQKGGVWIEDRGVVIRDREVLRGPRVGVDYAGKDAALPWRFRVRGA